MIFLYDNIVLYTFASDEIFRRIASKHHESLLAQAKKIFDAGVGAEIYGGVSVGNLF